MTNKTYVFSVIGVLLLYFLGFNLISSVMFLMKPEAFYFRAWEYFSEVAYQYPGFLPTWHGEESSDLTRSHYFYYRDEHVTKVNVNKEGHRVTSLVAENYPIVVSGDSTIFGSGLSDDETLPWVLSQKLDIPVYNAGRTGLFNALKLPELAHTEIVFYCRTERVLKKDSLSKEFETLNEQYSPLLKNSGSLYRLLLDVPSDRYLITSIISRIISRISNDIKLIFLRSEKKPWLYKTHTMHREDLIAVAADIIKASNEIKRRGIRYIFVAIPAKQTIYRSDVDLFTQWYIAELTKIIKNAGVETLRLDEVFFKNKEKILFRPYDSHWNGEGTQLAAEHLAEYVFSNDTLK